MGIVDLVGRGLGCERSGIVSLHEDLSRNFDRQR